MPSESVFLENAWYVAALSRELNATDLLHRTLLNKGVVIYRTQDGTPVALQDRCPHRFVPLHLGRRDGDELICPYHGLRFDCTGACTQNPHGGGHIPKAAKVRAYPLQERYGFIWIWMGDATPDADLLHDYAPLVDGHENALGQTYMHLKANYELIIDNVMDLSHVDHLHSEIISTRGQLTPLIPQVVENAGSVSARWEWRQTPGMLIFNNFLPDPQAETRMFVQVNWASPANIQLSIGATQGNGPLDLDACIGQYDLHTVTPETATTSHYWFATRRNHLVEDAEFNAAKIQAMHGAFVNEDGPIIEAVEQEMGGAEFFSLSPVLMSNDAAPVRVRRLLRQMIAAQG
ncbi:aromatic ring-hydroxylating dioxygenase subunit alpha [Xanthobacter autotrophicus]|uniref:aromatic ring-hydroxylating dioxygenase subunit alpha n=1 Tax=Xanthobacter TaxID=279 RepID=UPI0024AAEFB1|nr:aromatic ring-hydroxylating dioxygenase subunit alpha [Xanthobacter autotrophicus]MDI4665623.1 aromatic ring-hydroxylating dioxygenase subunit alpha [Xanthobacter autotrophicus]